MMICFGPIKDIYGENSFVETDYKEYLEAHGVEYFGNELFSGLILENDDDKDSIKAFIELSAANKVSFIVVEYCNCTKQELVNYTHELLAKLTKYTNMNSYETKDAYCLKAWERKD